MTNADLLKSMDLSRLNVTALENNKMVVDIIVIVFLGVEPR